MFAFHKDMTLNGECTTCRARGRERVKERFIAHNQVAPEAQELLFPAILSICHQNGSYDRFDGTKKTPTQWTL
ncbi:hypothetical protein Y032_0041g409 [Ancylostoma ceylanicum]|uniref:Uncharacterized protein n=1 Tax=Ancylostoma ceylanicum TaxID=53326 RepID=A0A016UGC9_9BILA|nr:hypothetical protein Y032_0041g409 [Ancylostoma ceylanicum]